MNYLKFALSVCIVLGLSLQAQAKKSTQTRLLILENKSFLKDVSRKVSGKKPKTVKHIREEFESILGRDVDAKLNVLLVNRQFRRFLKFGLEKGGGALESKVINIISLLPRLDLKDENAEALKNVISLYMSNPSYFAAQKSFRNLIEELSIRIKEIESERSINSNDLVRSFEESIAKVEGLSLTEIKRMCRV